MKMRFFQAIRCFVAPGGRCDFYGGDSRAMHNSLAKLALLEGDRPVYPGHEGETSLDQERKYNRFMGSKQ